MSLPKGETACMDAVSSPKRGGSFVVVFPFVPGLLNSSPRGVNPTIELYLSF